VNSAQEQAARLLRDIGCGSAEAFESLYSLYAEFIYHIALKITKSPADAEDMCHEVFLEVWRQASSYDAERGTAEAWLAVKTRTRCLDLLRRRQRREARRRELSALVEPAAASTEEAALASVGFAQLQDALQHIPAAQRQAVYGAYVEELTHTELAKRMNRPLGTVKSFVRYGLKHLRRQLTASGVGAMPAQGGDGRSEASL
jgi:RNA polymerase sigma-70 factor (ECF subfamily)